MLSYSQEALPQGLCQDASLGKEDVIADVAWGLYEESLVNKPWEKANGGDESKGLKHEDH